MLKIKPLQLLFLLLAFGSVPLQVVFSASPTDPSDGSSSLSTELPLTDANGTVINGTSTITSLFSKRIIIFIGLGFTAIVIAILLFTLLGFGIYRYCCCCSKEESSEGHQPYSSGSPHRRRREEYSHQQSRSSGGGGGSSRRRSRSFSRSRTVAPSSSRGGGHQHSTSRSASRSRPPQPKGTTTTLMYPKQLTALVPARPTTTTTAAPSPRHTNTGGPCGKGHRAGAAAAPATKPTIISPAAHRPAPKSKPKSKPKTKPKSKPKTKPKSKPKSRPTRTRPRPTPRSRTRKKKTSPKHTTTSVSPVGTTAESGGAGMMDTMMCRPSPQFEKIRAAFAKEQAGKKR